MDPSLMYTQQRIAFQDPIVQSLSFDFGSDLENEPDDEEEEDLRQDVLTTSNSQALVVPRDSICMRDFLNQSQQQHLDLLFLLKNAHASVEAVLNRQETIQKATEEPPAKKKTWSFLKRLTGDKTNHRFNIHTLPNKQEPFMDDDRFLRLKKNSFDMITDHVDQTCRHTLHLTKNLQSMAKIMQELSASKHIRNHQKSLMNASIGVYELSFWFDEELLTKKLQPKKKELDQFQLLLDRRYQLKQKLPSKSKNKRKNISKSKQKKYERSNFSSKQTTEINDTVTSQINHLHAVSCAIERVFRMHRHLDSYILEEESTQVRHALGQAFQYLFE